VPPPQAALFATGTIAMNWFVPTLVVIELSRM
jgi:hypothetical protein